MEHGIEQSVDARETMNHMLGQLPENGRQVTRIGQEDVLSSEPGAQQQVDGKGKDVIQRQSADKCERVMQRLVVQGWQKPQFTLDHIGKDVAMRKHGRLGLARCAAGILQDGGILRVQGDRLMGRGQMPRQRIIETHRSGQAEGWHHPPDMPHHQINPKTFQGAQPVANGRQHHMPDRGLRQTLLQHMRRVFDNKYGLSAAIPELVLQFGRREQRVHIDQNQACAPYGGNRNQVLRHIGHHHGHTIAPIQVQGLQIGSHAAAGQIPLGISHLRAKKTARRLAVEPAKAFIQHIHHGTAGNGRQVRRHTLRILTQPGTAFC